MSYKKSISFVIPIYFEELVIETLYKRILNVIKNLEEKFLIEIIFVNDGSTDDSCRLLKNICNIDPRCKLIDLSRNFGHQLAITAGIDFSIGDAVIVMDGDLQDPPELVAQLIAKWEEGFQVVYAEREARRGEGVFKKVSAHLFYKLLNCLTDISIPRNVGDFRLMDRVVVDELCKLRESSRYVRGLISWIGFNQCAVTYVRDPRYAGTTKYSLRKMFQLAFDGIINFSEKPLYLASYIGFLISLASFIWGLLIVYNYFFGHFTAVWGWSSIMVTILFIGGLQIGFIGLIGQYLGRTYSEVRRRPLYVIKEKLGFNEANSKP